MASIVAICLGIVWLFWFLGANITLYETSTIQKITPEGLVIAHFSPEIINQIQYKDAAFIRLEQQFGVPIMIPAYIIEVDTLTGQMQVSPQQVEDVLHFQDMTTGQVVVSIEQVSPATLVIRAAGLFAPAGL